MYVTAYSKGTLITGTSVAPPNGTVIADTGALPAGDYEVIWRASSDEAAGANFVIFAWRNAANAADNQKQLGMIGATVPAADGWLPRVTIAANERFRITNSANGGALKNYNASIWYRKL